MIEQHEVDIVHPDLLTSGGMSETKRIADYADRYGLTTAMHFAGSSIAFMAAVHCAASFASFVALEHHGLDLPFWSSLVTGLPDDYMADGYCVVPDKPGLGVDLNEAAISAHLRTPGTLFQPTEAWNTPKLGFWRPEVPWKNWED
jgi:L-alanine-DL-glutamate epimerase-like enolase superfamily enzyme